MKQMSYYEQSRFGAVGSNYMGAYGGFDGQGESAELRETQAIEGKGGVLPGPLEAGVKEVYDLAPLPQQYPQEAVPASAPAQRSTFPWVPIAVLGALAVGGGIYVTMKNRPAAT